MKKIVVIGAPLVLVVIVMVVLLLLQVRVTDRGSEAGTSPGAESVESGWKRITYPKEYISALAPSGWNTVFFEDINKGFSSHYSEGGNIGRIVFLCAEESSISNEESMLRSRYRVEIEKAGDEKLNYYGKLTQEQLLLGEDSPGEDFGDTYNEEEGSFDNSYISGTITKIDGCLVKLECSIFGPNYADFISVCNKVIKSLSTEK